MQWLRSSLKSCLTANVMATVAVFIAIGGGAYAAGLAKNSVGSKQIKDGQVPSVAVKVASLLGTDINAAKRTFPQATKGATGANGATKVPVGLAFCGGCRQRHNRAR